MGNLCFFNKRSGESWIKNGKKRPSLLPSTAGPTFKRLPNPVKYPSFPNFVL